MLLDALKINEIIKKVSAIDLSSASSSIKTSADNLADYYSHFEALSSRNIQDVHENMVDEIPSDITVVDWQTENLIATLKNLLTLADTAETEAAELLGDTKSNGATAVAPAVYAKTVSGFTQQLLDDKMSVSDLVKTWADKGYSRSQLETVLTNYREKSGKGLPAGIATNAAYVATVMGTYDKYVSAKEAKALKAEQAKAKARAEVEARAKSKVVVDDNGVIKSTLTTADIDKSKIYFKSQSTVKSADIQSGQAYKVVAGDSSKHANGAITEAEYALLVATIAGEVGNCTTEQNFGCASAFLNGYEMGSNDFEKTLSTNCWRWDGVGGAKHNNYLNADGTLRDCVETQNARKGVDLALSGQRAFASSVIYWSGDGKSTSWYSNVE